MGRPMGAIYGIFGEADIGEVDLMGERLMHRGVLGGSWSVAPYVHFGQRFWSLSEETLTPPENPIILDGFIDNSSEIMFLLGCKDSDDSSDANLIFELYQKLGPEGFRHISGQFALAIWDGSRQCLILACDSWSTRPLYLTHADGRYLFASEYKALLAIEALSARPNRDAIQYLQCTKYVMTGACCLADVYPVTGGTWLELTNRGKSLHRYQNLMIDISNRSDNEHAEALRKSFIESVRRQTRRFKTIAVSLSGGLDSALIVAAVRIVAPEKTLHTFTAGFGPDDECFAEAAEVALYFRTLHHEIYFPVNNLMTLLPRTLWYMEDPIGREEKLFYYVTALEAAKHVPVLLAGHNADALFGGMPRHLIAKVALWLPLIYGPLTEFYHYTQMGERPRSLLGRVLVKAYYKGTDIGPPRVLGASTKPQGSGFARQSPQSLSELLKNVQISSPNANSAIEKIHAAAGITFNSPFLDTDLVRCSFQIPDRLKIHGFRQKYILRKAFFGLLPEDMLNRKKGLLRLKHDKQLCDMLDELADDLLRPQAVKSRGLFEPSYVSRVRVRPRGHVYPTDQIYRLWSLLLTEIWCRIFIDARGNTYSVT